MNIRSLSIHRPQISMDYSRMITPTSNIILIWGRWGSVMLFVPAPLALAREQYHIGDEKHGFQVDWCDEWSLRESLQHQSPHLFEGRLDLHTKPPHHRRGHAVARRTGIFFFHVYTVIGLYGFIMFIRN